MAMRMPLSSPPASPIVEILLESKYKNPVQRNISRLDNLEFQSRSSPDGEVRSRDLEQYYYAHCRLLRFVRRRWGLVLKITRYLLACKGICIYVCNSSEAIAKWMINIWRYEERIFRHWSRSRTRSTANHRFVLCKETKYQKPDKFCLHVFSS